jgi:hypothetical protein
VKVLDFGLAKAFDFTARSEAALQDAAASPTMLSPAQTTTGMILGTAGYMSPEQARGRPVDKRADVWAFGVVLFEMLTRTRLFDEETVTDTLAAVVTREPEWQKLPRGTPDVVRRLLARCLDRDPKRRLRDIGEARVALRTRRSIRCRLGAGRAAPGRRARRAGGDPGGDSRGRARPAGRARSGLRTRAARDTPVMRFDMNTPLAPRPARRPTGRRVPLDGAVVAAASDKGTRKTGGVVRGAGATDRGSEDGTIPCSPTARRSPFSPATSQEGGLDGSSAVAPSLSSARVRRARQRHDLIVSSRDRL